MQQVSASVPHRVGLGDLRHFFERNVTFPRWKFYRQGPGDLRHFFGRNATFPRWKFYQHGPGDPRHFFERNVTFPRWKFINEVSSYFPSQSASQPASLRLLRQIVSAPTCLFRPCLCLLPSWLLKLCVPVYISRHFQQ